MSRLLYFAAACCFFFAGIATLGWPTAASAPPPVQPTNSATVTSTVAEIPTTTWTAPQETLVADGPPSHEGGYLYVGEPFIYETPIPGPADPPPSNGDEILGFPNRTKPASPPSPNGNKVVAVTVKVSYYVPNWGGTNCYDFRSELPPWASKYPNADRSRGWCWSRFSSGKDWEESYGYGAACPAELPFGTKIYAFGREWECLDRGGKIVNTGSAYWVDFLTYPIPADFGTEVPAVIIYP